jgi:ribosome-interacting GTPase 1
MNEYEVRYVYELVNIMTIATGEDEHQALRGAEGNLANAGIVLDETPNEVVITKTGEYA